MKRGLAGKSLEVIEADITTLTVDAIVNAANSRLAGGGGVDGAIHRAGGPEILEACRRLGGCPPGQAVATPAGRLPCRWVIHAVGPIYRDGQRGESEILAAAYRHSLERAAELGATSVAFPSIATGAYRFPLEPAASIAIDTVAGCLAQGVPAVREVTFALFDRHTFEAYARALKALGPLWQ